MNGWLLNDHGGLRTFALVLSTGALIDRSSTV
jgi:hypothetical protein